MGSIIPPHHPSSSFSSTINQLLIPHYTSSLLLAAPPPPTTMAAAVIGSHFSTSIHSLNSTRSKTLLPFSSSDHSLKLTPTRNSHLTSLSNFNGIELIPISVHSSNKWPRISRVSASVTEGEAAPTAVAEEEVEMEVKEEHEQVGEGEGEGISSVVVNTKLYFGNLPYHVDSAKLAGIVQEYANPELVEVLYDKGTRRSKGYGFVTMSSIEDCEKVIENLDGSEYGGRILRVNFSDKPKPKLPLYRETAYKLFVGNLSWSTTSETLTEVFQQYGNVVSARIIYDGETGNSRGYGFICYSSQSELDEALDSDPVEIDGRTIRVTLAGTGNQASK